MGTFGQGQVDQRPLAIGRERVASRPTRGVSGVQDAARAPQHATMDLVPTQSSEGLEASEQADGRNQGRDPAFEGSCALA